MVEFLSCRPADAICTCFTIDLPHLFVFGSVCDKMDIFQTNWSNFMRVMWQIFTTLFHAVRSVATQHRDCNVATDYRDFMSPNAHSVKQSRIGKCEDLSRCWNKIESVGLRKCPHYHCLTNKKWCQNNKHFSELGPHHGGKTAGMLWRNYVTVVHWTFMVQWVGPSGHGLFR